jgi:DivIVA domain-containing protein
MPEHTALDEWATQQLPARRDPEFRMVVRGYDRDEVDAYVARLRDEIKRSEENRSPSGAVRRALDQVGDEVSGILQRAHETAAELTAGSRKEAEGRLESARREAEQRLAQARIDAAAITAEAEAKLRELDIDTDRIWAERARIVGDARDLAGQLLELATAAADRFPPEEGVEETVEVLPEDVIGGEARNGGPPLDGPR